MRMKTLSKNIIRVKTRNMKYAEYSIRMNNKLNQEDNRLGSNNKQTLTTNSLDKKKLKKKRQQNFVVENNFERLCLKIGV